MARTTEAAVREIAETDPDIKLVKFIQIASVLTERIKSCALSKGTTLSDEELTLLETLLAAHFYHTRDQRYTSKSTGAASASFADSSYLEDAKLIDSSGCLNAMTKGSRASMVSLRTPHSADRELD